MSDAAPAVCYFELTAYSHRHKALRLLRAYIHRESKKGDTILLSISLLNIDRFLADRTIGRAFGTVCRLSVCLLSVVCLSVCL